MSAFDIASIAALLGAGFIGGLLWVFSFTVMKALDRIPATKGMHAMQSINQVIQSPHLFLPFFGTVIAGGVAVAMGPGELLEGVRLPALIGTVLYTFGCVAVTAGRNVPWNERLDKVNPDDPASEQLWQDYVRVWTKWNHLRVVCCALAVIVFAIGLSA